MADQAEAVRKLANDRTKQGPRMIAVTSGKGGVGKTNVSVNLGMTLAAQGYNVGLLDADLGLANMEILLGLQPTYTLNDVITSKRQIDEIMVDGPMGVKLISGGSCLFDVANLDTWQLGKLIRSINRINYLLDFLIIDTGAGIHQSVLSFVLAVDEVVVVTTPEITAFTDAYGMIKVISLRNPQCRVCLAVNMTRNNSDGRRVWQKLNMVARRFLSGQIEYLGGIPYDNRVSQSVDKQVPFVIGFPRTQASRALEEIAGRLVKGEASESVKRAGAGSMIDRIYNLLRTK